MKHKPLFTTAARNETRRSRGFPHKPDENRGDLRAMIIKRIPGRLQAPLLTVMNQTEPVDPFRITGLTES
jgi:hypothetical protein